MPWQTFVFLLLFFSNQDIQIWTTEQLPADKYEEWLYLYVLNVELMHVAVNENAHALGQMKSRLQEWVINMSARSMCMCLNGLAFAQYKYEIWMKIFCV